jgi:hypothetical protein
MRKLKLDLDHLAVQSFSPAPARRGRGTAHAHAADALLPEPETGGVQPEETKVDCFTCELSCRGC